MKKSARWAVGMATAVACAVGTGAPALAAAPVTPASATLPVTVQAQSGSSTPTGSDAQLQADLDALQAALPDGWQASVAAARAQLGDSSWRAVRDQALAASSSGTCAATALTDYVQQQQAAVTNGVVAAFLAEQGVLDLPALYALYFETDTTPQYFGADGGRTTELTHEMRDLKRFWDVNTADVQLVAMHGDFFDHPEKVARVVAVLAGSTPQDPHVVGLATLLSQLVQQAGLDGSPLLTLNASSAPAQAGPDGVIPPKIVIGDGMLQALDAVGLGDMGPRAVLAHEFSHQVQFDDGIFDGTHPPTPEATRHNELMADAFGTFFLTHKRGEALNAKRLLTTEASFYTLGDCATDSDNHHGTPTQRLSASTWGAQVAASQQKQGQIMPSLALDGLFERQLPELLATPTR